MQPERRDRPDDDPRSESRGGRSQECAEVHERLPLHVGGDLEASAAVEVAAHLENCADCRAELARLDRARQGFFEVLHRGAAEELAREGLWKGIAAQLAREGAGRGFKSGSERRSSETSRRAAAAAEDHDVAVADVLKASESSAVELAVASVGTLHEYGHPGRRALRLLAGATLVAAAALLVSVVLYKAPRRDQAPSIADASGAGDVDGAVANGALASALESLENPAPGTSPTVGGLERLGVADQDRRLLSQPREMELPALRGGREALVGNPTWR